MDLAEFVKSSIVQIIQGVSHAIEETRGNSARAVINPTLQHASHGDINAISFDVAVTVQEEAGIKGSGGIKVFGAQIGVGADKTLSNTAVSRLSFSVPVALPSIAKERYPTNRGNLTAKADYNPYGD